MARYTLIKGTFPIVNTEPDGDTIRFRPDDPRIVEGLGPEGQRPDFSQQGTQINVRFEGIDALETHFSGTHQELRLGQRAAAQMLAVTGFTAVARSGNRVTGATPTSLRGHVFANTLDSFGRMIAFVFASEHPEADGSPIFLHPPTMGRSVNAALLAEGLAYPAFYTTLPVDLRDNLKAQSKLVRERAIGLWPEDAPSVSRAAAVPDLRAAEDLVMWPKLFRRLVSYFQSGNAGLAGFDAWLRADPRNRDDFLQLPDGELGNMHDLVEVSGDMMRLRFLPEDLVVLPDAFVPDPSQPPVPTDPQPGEPSVPQTPPMPPKPPTNQPPSVRGDEALRIIAALVNPVGDDVGLETVTLINCSAAAVALDGWQIRDRQLHATAQAGHLLAGTLAAGETLRVALGTAVQLGNSGDDLVLVDPLGRAVQAVTFTRSEAHTHGGTLLF
jgi:endonuclease YncB( thermonuclease family)